MTDKQFVLQHNPNLKFPSGSFQLCNSHIFILDSHGNISGFIPRTEENEKEMWARFRQIMEHQMLKKLENAI